ncbi:hypothetical protein [Limnospira platensis]|uniref:hypothetical protein n=1 Tax=Limnospira platensis TaxID=118562 RepID=UPI0025703C3A
MVKACCTNPIKAFFSHQGGNDNINAIAIIFVGGVLQCGCHFIPLAGVIIHQIGNLENLTRARF